jgi:hypothetical protein
LWGQQTMHPQPGAGVRRPGRIFGMPPRSPPHRLVHERTVSPLRFMPAVYQQSSGEVGRPGSLLGCIRYTVSRRLPACQARQSWPPPGPRSPGSSLVADDSITLATARAAFPRVVPGGRRQHHPRHRPSRVPPGRPWWQTTASPSPPPEPQPAVMAHDLPAHPPGIEAPSPEPLPLEQDRGAAHQPCLRS